MSYKVITFFSDVQFQSLLVFPYLDIKKQANYWNVKIAISKLLYEYPYSFAFPNTFLNYQNSKIYILEFLSRKSDISQYIALYLLVMETETALIDRPTKVKANANRPNLSG